MLYKSGQDNYKTENLEKALNYLSSMDSVHFFSLKMLTFLIKN